MQLQLPELRLLVSACLCHDPIWKRDFQLNSDLGVKGDSPFLIEQPVPTQ
jgi:hypothetical protein